MRTVCVSTLLIAASACTGSENGCPAFDPPELPPAQQSLLHPDADHFSAAAPDSFRVRLETTEGDIVVQVVRAWAPLGADRFHALVRAGFFDNTAFFRVIPGFVAQFGMKGIPAVDEAWFDAPLPDEPVAAPNTRYTLTYAKAGPNTRTTQLFINYRDNSEILDDGGFAPIGRVVEGSDVLLRLYGEYGDFPPQGAGPDPQCLLRGGNAYLERRYENLDWIRSATIVS